MMHNIYRLSYIPVIALALASCAQSVSADPKRVRNIAAQSDVKLERPSTDTLKSSMLKNHDDARKEAGTPPLSWDDNLANDARKYAQILAKKNIFEHDPQTGVAVRQGENLWMGTRGAFGFDMMAYGWISEKHLYKKGVFPDNSINDNWAEVGHYTQIIWRDTTHLGCAIASNKQSDFLVCRYSPAGNFMGQDPVKGSAKN